MNNKGRRHSGGFAGVVNFVCMCACVLDWEKAGLAWHVELVLHGLE